MDARGNQALKMKVEELNINWSEMTDNKTILFGVKQVSIALFFKQLITYDEFMVCVKTGIPPNNLSTPGLEQVFKEGLILDRCKDAFEFLSVRILFRDPTLYN